MSLKHLRGEPHHLRATDKAWWYESNGGMDIVVEASPKTEVIRILWSQIRKALARKDKK